MARVALVTGGTRGIGAAISTALKGAGFKVAANYGGNDEAANRFKDETGIPVYRFDVGDFEARSEEHTSELQSLMRTSYAVFCLKKKKQSKAQTDKSRTSIKSDTSN